MSNFVDVPADALFSRLEAAGFRRGVQGREVVYERSHAQDSRLSVRVYTSVTDGATDARAKDSDAIRVVAQFQWLHRQSNEMRRKNLFSAKVLRVTSVEGVVERMIDAARKAYAACNEFRKNDAQQRAAVRPALPAPTRAEVEDWNRRGVTDDDAYDEHRERYRR